MIVGQQRLRRGVCEWAEARSANTVEERSLQTKQGKSCRTGEVCGKMFTPPENRAKLCGNCEANSNPSRKLEYGPCFFNGNTLTLCDPPQHIQCFLFVSLKAANVFGVVQLRHCVIFLLKMQTTRTLKIKLGLDNYSLTPLKQIWNAR